MGSLFPPKVTNWKGRIRVIGVYKIVPTMESIIEAAKYQKCPYLIDEKGKFTDEIYWDNFENLGLIELEIPEDFKSDDVSYITQEGNDQAAYLEFYLDDKGTRLLTKDEEKLPSKRRLCFFLHFIDTSKPLTINTDKFALMPMRELPDRLKPYAHFIPVD